MLLQPLLQSYTKYKGICKKWASNLWQMFNIASLRIEFYNAMNGVRNLENYISNHSRSEPYCSTSLIKISGNEEFPQHFVITRSL